MTIITNLVSNKLLKFNEIRWNLTENEFHAKWTEPPPKFVRQLYLASGRPKSSSVILNINLQGIFTRRGAGIWSSSEQSLGGTGHTCSHLHAVLIAPNSSPPPLPPWRKTIIFSAGVLPRHLTISIPLLSQKNVLSPGTLRTHTNWLKMQEQCDGTKNKIGNFRKKDGTCHLGTVTLHRNLRMSGLV